MSAFYRNSAAGMSSLALAMSAHAGTVIVSGSSGALRVSATFENSGGNLIFRLSRTADGVVSPADMLNAVSFELVTGETITPRAAILSDTLVNFGPTGGANVGGAWGSGAAAANSSAGFREVFGRETLFVDQAMAGGALEGPCLVGGSMNGPSEYFPGYTPRGGGENEYEIVVAFGGLADHFDPGASIRDVSFQFGEYWTEPLTPRGVQIPLPGASALGLAGLGVLAARRARRMV